MYGEEGRTAKLYIISLAAGQFMYREEGRTAKLYIVASTKRPLMRTSLPYITVLVCVIPCIIYS